MEMDVKFLIEMQMLFLVYIWLQVRVFARFKICKMLQNNNFTATTTGVCSCCSKVVVFANKSTNKITTLPQQLQGDGVVAVKLLFWRIFM